MLPLIDPGPLFEVERMVLGLHTRSLTLLKAAPRGAGSNRQRMIDESVKWLITKQPKGEAVTQQTPLLTNLEPHDRV